MSPNPLLIPLKFPLFEIWIGTDDGWNSGDFVGGCGSFYAIQLSSKEFKGMSTVKAHRMVNGELKDVIKDIHGLQVSPLPRPLTLLSSHLQASEVHSSN